MASPSEQRGIDKAKEFTQNVYTSVRDGIRGILSDSQKGSRADFLNLTGLNDEDVADDKLPGLVESAIQYRRIGKAALSDIKFKKIPDAPDNAAAPATLDELVPTQQEIGITSQAIKSATQNNTGDMAEASFGHIWQGFLNDWKENNNFFKAVLDLIVTVFTALFGGDTKNSPLAPYIRESTNAGMQEELGQSLAKVRAPIKNMVQAAVKSEVVDGKPFSLALPAIDRQATLQAAVSRQLEPMQAMMENDALKAFLPQMDETQKKALFASVSGVLAEQAGKQGERSGQQLYQDTRTALEQKLGKGGPLQNETSEKRAALANVAALYFATEMKKGEAIIPQDMDATAQALLNGKLGSLAQLNEDMKAKLKPVIENLLKKKVSDTFASPEGQQAMNALHFRHDGGKGLEAARNAYQQRLVDASAAALTDLALKAPAEITASEAKNQIADALKKHDGLLGDAERDLIADALAKKYMDVKDKGLQALANDGGLDIATVDKTIKQEAVEHIPSADSILKEIQKKRDEYNGFNQWMASAPDDAQAKKMADEVHKQLSEIIPAKAAISIKNTGKIDEKSFTNEVVQELDNRLRQRAANGEFGASWKPGYVKDFFSDMLATVRVELPKRLAAFPAAQTTKLSASIPASPDKMASLMPSPSGRFRSAEANGDFKAPVTTPPSTPLNPGMQLS